MCSSFFFPFFHPRKFHSKFPRYLAFNKPPHALVFVRFRLLPPYFFLCRFIVFTAGKQIQTINADMKSMSYLIRSIFRSAFVEYNFRLFFSILPQRKMKGERTKNGKNDVDADEVRRSDK